MKAFIRHNLVRLALVIVSSFLLFCSCNEAEITRYLKPPAWIEVNKVSGTRLDLRWESVYGAKQYVVYKAFNSKEEYTFYDINVFSSQYEIARTTVPEYQYEGSYDPKEDGYNYIQYCYFGVRVVDENGNMSQATVVTVP